MRHLEPQDACIHAGVHGERLFSVWCLLSLCHFCSCFVIKGRVIDALVSYHFLEYYKVLIWHPSSYKEGQRMEGAQLECPYIVQYNSSNTLTMQSWLSFNLAVLVRNHMQKPRLWGALLVLQRQPSSSFLRAIPAPDGMLKAALLQFQGAGERA